MSHVSEKSIETDDLPYEFNSNASSKVDKYFDQAQNFRENQYERKGA